MLAAAAALACPGAPASAAPVGAPGTPQPRYTAKDSVTKGGYTLVFISKDSAFSAVTKQRMMDTFFAVYPREARRFNPRTLKKITFVIDPAYDGVAATGNGVATYSPKWLRDHPEDLDVVTHEVMHVVQAYPDDSCPGWLTEGIADYARYAYGVNNVQGHWALPDYQAGQQYTNSYRVVARFLVWLEQHGHPALVTKLDAAARSRTYSAALWQQQTGHTLDELWARYAAAPAVKLAYH
ncbi:MAG: basic secretory protein-like protein [Janthinobacterium lividum]